MLLQRLTEYGGRAPSGVPSRYKTAPVKYMVYLDGEGGLRGIVEQSDGGVYGRKNRGKELVVPNVSRTAGSKANLLADNAEYALGIPRDREKAEKTPERRRLFLDLARHCADQTGEPAVRAVVRFLEPLEPAALPLPDEFDPNATVAFTVVIDDEDVRPVERPAVQRYWAEQKDGAGGGDGDSDSFECLVCGTRGPVEKTLELKVKRIPNGQPTGTALISANKPAFLSYGLKQSENSPVCARCAEGFSNALNSLIEDENTTYRVGALRYVFWTKQPVAGFSWGALVKEPDPRQVRELLASFWRAGAGATVIDPTPFYAVALTASGGRAVVRDWLESTVGRAQRALARYFALQDLAEWDGGEGTPLPLFRLAAATVRFRSGDDPSPIVPRSLLRLALAGGVLPRSLLYEAVRRNRAEQSVRRERAALIKMVLMSERDEEGAGWMVTLDETGATLADGEERAAYACGRLLAVIEAVQRAALGNINATVVDRFYGTASSAPMAVFSRLLRGAQPHLAKLRRDRPGAYMALDRRLQDVMAPIGRFPTVLSLREQGLFALGYYHQRAADRQAAATARARGQTPAVDDDADEPDTADE